MRERADKRNLSKFWLGTVQEYDISLTVILILSQ
jgi:hypothetical protein